MSTAEIKEIISFIGIALLIIAILLITLSRNKLSGIFSKITALIAYFCLIIGAIIVIYIVFSGPTS